MDERLKQRLIGAAVLVSAAVIFVPMILDEPLPEVTSPEVPEAPKEQVPDYLEVLELPPRDELPEAGDARQPSETDQPAEPDGQGQAESAPPEPAPRPAEKAASEPPAATAKAEKAGTAPSPPPKAAAEPKPKGPVGEVGWVVQLGSFSERARADSVVGQVRAGKNSAFVVEARSGGKKVYRVYVGPFVQRSEAEHQLGPLAKTTSLSGYVRHYDPLNPAD